MNRNPWRGRLFWAAVVLGLLGLGWKLAPNYYTRQEIAFRLRWLPRSFWPYLSWLPTAGAAAVGLFALVEGGRLASGVAGLLTRPPPSLSPREQADRWCAKVGDLFRSNGAEALIDWLPRPTLIAQQLEQASKEPKLDALECMARAHEATGDGRNALARAREALQAGSTSTVTQEVFVRCSFEAGVKVRIEELIPVLQRLFSHWHPDYEPMAFEFFRYVLTRMELSSDLLQSVWPVVQTVSMVPEVMTALAELIASSSESDPRRADAFSWVARADWRRGNGPRAIQVCEEAMNRSLDVPEVYRLLKEIFEERGELSALRENYLAVITEGRTHGTLERAIKDLEALT